VEEEPICSVFTLESSLCIEKFASAPLEAILLIRFMSIYVKLSVKAIRAPLEPAIDTCGQKTWIWHTPPLSRRAERDYLIYQLLFWSFIMTTCALSISFRGISGPAGFEITVHSSINVPLIATICALHTSFYRTSVQIPDKTFL
jgi:hypothetical protein